MNWIIGSVRRFLGHPRPRLLGSENSLPIKLPKTRAHDADAERNESCNDYDHYDVFINHRGPDVKGTFAAHLEDSLICAGFHPFLDKISVKKGDHALRAIDRGLEASDVHVAIVSKRYAESTYCLNELVAMLGSGKPIVPVFYDIEPKHLRHVLLSGPFKSAFENHMKKGREEEVKQWVDALGKLADLMAFRLADYKGDEAKLKHEVVEEVKRLLPSNLQVPVGKSRVGLRTSTIFCIKKLEIMGPNTGALSLVGMGGVGKTTLSRGIYNYFAHMKKYHSMTFLHDIRSAYPKVEYRRKLGLVELQNQLLWDLLRVKNTTRDYNFWFQKLSSRGPVFIVLDNIDSKDQFEQLIPDVNLLGQGSRVILTSRDKSMLSVIPREFPTYQHAVEPLESLPSQRLFNWHAFGNETVPEEFQDLAANVANACHGLPLALKVMGSSLAGKRTFEDRQTIWSEAVEYLKENADVMRVLQWSYDCLPSKSEKVMFVDIACSIHCIDKTTALACWEACKHCTLCSGFRNPHSSLQCLFERCLVEEDVKHCLIIHDLLQDMAKKTVREQSEDPRRHSHQFDVHVAEQIVAENEGTKHIRSLTLAGSKKRKFSAKNFGKMEALHYLVLDGCQVTGNFKRFPKKLRYLQWRAMPYSQLPATLDFSSLSALDLSESSEMVKLWSNSKQPMQRLSSLRTLKMSSCFSITALPESIGDLSKLDQLDLGSCSSLTNLPESIGLLKELRNLNLESCKSLEMLPSNIGVLTNLECLNMNICKQLKCLPDSIGQLASLRDLSLTKCSLTELPESLGFLPNLKRLDLHGSFDLNIGSFPNTLCNLTALREAEFGDCSSLMEIPSFLEELCNLDYLGLDNCNLDIESAASFSGNTRLKILCLLNNTVTCLPEILRNLPHLEEIRVSEDLVDCTDVPDDFMIETFADESSFSISRTKTHFSLDTDSVALPID